ncbi:MAG: magnesium and cobalt transport protein CorA [Sphingomicrobium sp.]
MSVVASMHGGEGKPVWRPWEESLARPPEQGFIWIDVVDDGDEIGELQRVYGLHELAVEDSMSTSQPAKIDLYPDHVFVAAKAASLVGDEIEYTDVSIFLTERRVITVCRMKTSFNEELRSSVHRIARRKVDRAEYAVHEVLDRIVDGYFPVIQKIADEILMMEGQLLDDSLDREDIARIFRLRRETIHFQHVLTRMFEVCNKLANLDVPCISNDAKPYFRDVLDHLVHIDAMSNGLIDVIKTALEASNLLEQQRQSDITRQLAAWGGIIAVPSAIAGIYGMNFTNLPATHTSWGYWPILGLMAVICGLLYWRFRKLGWLRPVRPLIRQPAFVRRGSRAGFRARSMRSGSSSAEKTWRAHECNPWAT